MNFNLPLLSSCCYLSPRIGLIVWGCSKLIIDIIIIFYLIIYLDRGLSLIQESGYLIRSFRDTLIISSLVVITVIVDAIQHTVLIIGGYKRKVSFLKEYYIFAVIWWIFIAIVGLTGISISLGEFSEVYSTSDLGLLLFDIFGFLVYLALHVYFLLLVRSETIKLNIRRIDNSACEANSKPLST